MTNGIGYCCIKFDDMYKTSHSHKEHGKVNTGFLQHASKYRINIIYIKWYPDSFLKKNLILSAHLSSVLILANV